MRPFGGSDVILGNGPFVRVNYDYIDTAVQISVTDSEPLGRPFFLGFTDSESGPGEEESGQLDMSAEVDKFGGRTDIVRNVDAFYGTRFPDTFTGAEGTDFFSPQAGNDTVIGQGGVDVVRYSGAERIRADLVEGRIVNWWDREGGPPDRWTPSGRWRGSGRRARPIRSTGRTTATSSTGPAATT